MSAPSVNTTAARDALAWVTQEQPAAASDKSIWTWFWEAIQGDFNDERSTGQIAFDWIESADGRERRRRDHHVRAARGGNPSEIDRALRESEHAVVRRG